MTNRFAKELNDMTQITPQPGIMDIALYQGGAAHVDGVSNVTKLSSNENPLGPSPKTSRLFPPPFLLCSWRGWRISL